MKKVAIANVYNFVRVSHVEPSRFIQDDYDTIKNQIITNKQYKIPGSYALKHDAVIDQQYQDLFKTYLDDNDEISAWWEITEELCQRAGVRFPKNHDDAEMFDERVDSAYSIGYEPEARKKLVDAYMKDFHDAFGLYPKIIGSWVLDEVTLSYAAEKYGIIAGAICRDQMGTDGFTLWGGYPNGMYIPSKNNINTPANHKDNAINIVMFRLLSPDPIYSFEADVRDDLFGVYTLEPSWLAGRGDRIDWFFDRITKEDFLGPSYTMIGQENNFLWENIGPGYIPQIKSIKERADAKEIHLLTMEDSARYFLNKYQLTPSATFQATEDWDRHKNMQALWYASRYYRLGFLFENKKLRIRDLFVYRDDYVSRYRDQAMTDTRSTLDALPVLFPQIWRKEYGQRPFIKLIDDLGVELEDDVSFASLNETDYLITYRNMKQTITLSDTSLVMKGAASLRFDYLPNLMQHSRELMVLSHRGFTYNIRIRQGELIKISENQFQILPTEDKIEIDFSDNNIESVIQPDYIINKMRIEGLLERQAQAFKQVSIPLPTPNFEPKSSVFKKGESKTITIHGDHDIFFSINDEPYQLYKGPFTIDCDCSIIAYAQSDNHRSDVISENYDFAYKDFIISSDTRFDERLIFNRDGILDLLEETRGSVDYIDGRWLGSTEDIIFNVDFSSVRQIDSITLGFLTAHRSGIVFPKEIEIDLMTDEGVEVLQRTIPSKAENREIMRKDFLFTVNKAVKSFVVRIKRHDRMPMWCIYKGDTHVFTMVDNLIIK